MKDTCASSGQRLHPDGNGFAGLWNGAEKCAKKADPRCELQQHSAYDTVTLAKNILPSATDSQRRTCLQNALNGWVTCAARTINWSSESNPNPTCNWYCPENGITRTGVQPTTFCGTPKAGEACDSTSRAYLVTSQHKMCCDSEHKIVVEGKVSNGAYCEAPQSTCGNTYSSKDEHTKCHELSSVDVCSSKSIASADLRLHTAGRHCTWGKFICRKKKRFPWGPKVLKKDCPDYTNHASCVAEADCRWVCSSCSSNLCAAPTNAITQIHLGVPSTLKRFRGFGFGFTLAYAVGFPDYAMGNAPCSPNGGGSLAPNCDKCKQDDTHGGSEDKCMEWPALGGQGTTLKQFMGTFNSCPISLEQQNTGALSSCTLSLRSCTMSSQNIS